jgi:hypothetical protein
MRPEYDAGQEFQQLMTTVDETLKTTAVVVLTPRSLKRWFHSPTVRMCWFAILTAVIAGGCGGKDGSVAGPSAGSTNLAGNCNLQTRASSSCASLLPLDSRTQSYGTGRSYAEWQPSHLYVYCGTWNSSPAVRYRSRKQCLRST